MVSEGTEHANTEPIDTGVRVADEARVRHIDALNEEAQSCRRIDHARLLTLSEEAFELAYQRDTEGNQYNYGMAVALANLSYYHTSTGNWSDALSQAAQVLALLGEEPSPVLADVLGTIGWSHFCMGDFAEGLHHMLQGLEIAEKTGDLSAQAFMYDCIGTVQEASGEPEVALENHHRSLELHRQLGDELGEALTLNNMSYAQMSLDDYEGASASIEVALEYARRADLKHLLVAMIDTIAELRLRTGRLDEAELFSNHALALARELPSEPNQATCLTLLGRVAAARENWDGALQYVSEALALAEKLNLGVEIFTCHHLLSEICERKGELAGALEHFKKFHELKEAHVGEDTRLRLSNMHLSHQMKTARKDAEIHRLRSLALAHEVEERRLAQAALEAQASLDPLTGLFNRAHFALLAAEAIPAGNLFGPVSLLMLDIDHFKRVNDNHGHIAGDRVLKMVTRLIRSNSRQTDISCRYGGDEFLLLLNNMSNEDALSVAERLRNMIFETSLNFENHQLQVTVSVGVATAPAKAPWRLGALIEQADRALYSAKQTGRNRVVTHTAAPQQNTLLPL